jgi:chitin disaccharide deacetylase
VIVCADDYGLRDDIDEAILDLCLRGKLTAVSCMVAFERCNSDCLKRLRQHESQIDLGLHLCLTDEGLARSLKPHTPGSAADTPKYSHLLKAALTGQVSSQRIRCEVAAQYELFLAKCGRAPDHIDGHLHVHQLPGVRDGLLDFVLSLPPGQRPYLRNTSLPLPMLWRHRLPWLKAAAIGTFGSRMKARLRAAGLATNQCFAGVYDFRKHQQYPRYLPRFVNCLSAPTGILVVHPGQNEHWRHQEHAALHSFAFPVGSPNRFASP